MADAPALVTLSVEEITAIEERCEKATPLPWHAHGAPHREAVRLRKESTGVSGPDCLIYTMPRDYDCLPETFARQRRDADFIAHGRVDLPRALVTCRAFLELVGRTEQAKRAVDTILASLAYATPEVPQVRLDRLRDELATVRTLLFPPQGPR